MQNSKQKFNNLFLKAIFMALICVALCLGCISINTFALDKKDELQDLPHFTWQYEQFLSLTEEEQLEYGVLPRMYEVSSEALYSSKSYNSLLSSNQSLPTEYSLISFGDRSEIKKNFTPLNLQNNDNLPHYVGNQQGTNICWAFASLTAFESSLYKMGVTNYEANLNFSELDLAYTTQVANRDGLNVSGGTFDLAYEYLSSGQGPVNEKANETTSNYAWTSDVNATNYYAQNFYADREKSGYFALEACYYPSRSSLEGSAKTDLRNSIKNHIKTYGAVSASIFMDKGSVYEKFYYNYTGIKSANHAITLIGWDDDVTCTLYDTVYTGAYIAQNSYGTDFGDNGYFYVMYDDTNVEENVNGFVRVDEEAQNSLIYNNLEGTTFDNQFITVGNGYTYFLESDVKTKTSFVNIYQTKDVAGQYITNIKVPTVINSDRQASKFYVYILNDLTQTQVAGNNNIEQTLASKYSSKIRVKNIHANTDDEYLFAAQQNTFYTVEIDEQISLLNDYFAICVEYVSGIVYFKDNVVDSDGLLSNQKTYTSTNNGLSWQYYKGTYSGSNGTVLGNCIMPMYVQTEYALGTIEYTKSNVDEVYSAKEFSASVNVTNLDDYKILYSLDKHTWSENNFSFKNASEQNYVVYFKIIADFYKTVEDSLTIKISKKDLKLIPVEGQYKYYGEADSTIDHYYDGYMKGENPKAIGTLERNNGNDVGSYAIKLGSRTLVDNGSFLASNYNLVFDNTKTYYYEIKPRKLSVEVEVSGKIYGEADPDVFYIRYTNAVEVPQFDGYLKREQGEDVGLYGILKNTLVLVDNNSSNFKASNYELVFDEVLNQNKFEILPRSLVILPDSNIQKVYMQQDPDFTFTYINNLANETPNFEGSLGRTDGEDVGEYSYNLGSLSLCDNGDFKANNYSLLLAADDVKFVINYGTLAGCQVESREVFYDGKIYSLSPRSTIENNVTISYSTDNQNWQVGNASYKDVGEYHVYFKFEKANFNPVVLDATLIIKQFNLIIRPNVNQSKIYGDSDPVITLKFANSLLANEIPNYTGSLFRAEGEDVGEYLINSSSVKLVDNGSFKASNYNLIFDNLDNVTFKILPRQLVLVPSLNQGKIYGKVDPVLDFNIENLAYDEVAQTQGYLSRESGEDVGKYEINIGSIELVNTSNFNKDNYILNLSSEKVYFEIEKANITIQVDDKTSFYTEEVITDFTSTISGDYVEDDQLNIVYFCEVDKATLKGNYDIKASAENSNYNITILPGTYHVLFKTYEVKFYALGSYVKSVMVEHFSLINTHEIPKVVQDGYKFSNWKVINQDTSYRVIDVYEYQVTSDITLTASMELVDYKIYLHTNNQNDDVIEKTYTILDDDVVLDFVKKEGYTFENWFDNENFEGEPVIKVQGGSFGDKHFYAKWSINTYTISLPEQTDAYEIDCLGNSLNQLYNNYFDFKVILDSAYSQSEQTIKVYIVYNNNTHKEILTKNSLGVYSIENISNNYQIVVEDVVINTYLISFVIENKITKTITKTHGQTLDISEYPQIPVKDNYDDVPASWNIDNGILSVEENKTISAIYIPDIYDVVIVVSDKVINKQVVFGQDISEDELRKELNLNMFEYFVFDKALTNIDCDSVINAKVESKIYILYISLASFATLITLIVVFFAVRKHKRSKFKWWEYAKHSDDAGPSKKSKKK